MPLYLVFRYTPANVYLNIVQSEDVGGNTLHTHTFGGLPRKTNSSGIRGENSEIFQQRGMSSNKVIILALDEWVALGHEQHLLWVTLPKPDHTNDSKTVGPHIGDFV